jgi:hypothetical protein
LFSAMDIVGHPVDVKRLDERFRDAGGAIGHDGYVRHGTLLVIYSALDDTDGNGASANSSLPPMQ